MLLVIQQTHPISDELLCHSVVSDKHLNNNKTSTVIVDCSYQHDRYGAKKNFKKQYFFFNHIWQAHLLQTIRLKFKFNWSSLTMSNICYFYNRPVGHYDTHHMRNDMDTQFASKASASVSSFDPNFKIHQASFQAYKENNEDRTVVKKTDYGCIIGVFDGTRVTVRFLTHRLC